MSEAELHLIKKSIIIIALDNLIELCEDSLEYAEDDQKEYLNFLIDGSKLLIEEIGRPEGQELTTTIKRPQWKNQ